MNKNFLRLIATIKLHLKQHKIYCFTKSTKELLIFLDLLWIENLIWGYTFIKNDFIKIYLRYINNKSIIQSILVYKNFFSITKLKENIKLFPQSFFLIKTSQGFKSHKYCFKNNITGSLILKIN